MQTDFEILFFFQTSCQVSMSFSGSNWLRKPHGSPSLRRKTRFVYLLLFGCWKNFCRAFWATSHENLGKMFRGVSKIFENLKAFLLEPRLLTQSEGNFLWFWSNLIFHEMVVSTSLLLSLDKFYMRNAIETYDFIATVFRQFEVLYNKSSSLKSPYLGQSSLKSLVNCL